VRYVVSLGVAAVGVPLVAGLHATGGGFAYVFYVLAALAGGIFATALFFPSRRALDAQRAVTESASAPAPAGSR
jgi:hypothetical protein